MLLFMNTIYNSLKTSHCISQEFNNEISGGDSRPLE